MKKLRTSASFSLHGFPKTDFYEYVKNGLNFYKETGFDAVDFGTGMLDLSSDESRAQAELAVKAMEEVGIRFEVSHLPSLASLAKTEEALEVFNEKMYRAIDAVKIVGADYAVAHPYAVTMAAKHYSRKAQYEQVVENLAPFVEYANRIGVNIVVENMRIKPSFYEAHRYCQFPDELCEVADALGIGVCWDFGHANVSGVKQSEGLAYVGKRLKVLHVNDNNAFEDDHIFPFTGTVDWKDAMHGLALAEYEGLFNYELAVGKHPVTMRKELAAYLLTVANELMKYIE